MQWGERTQLTLYPGSYLRESEKNTSKEKGSLLATAALCSDTIMYNYIMSFPLTCIYCDKRG